VRSFVVLVAVACGGPVPLDDAAIDGGRDGGVEVPFDAGARMDGGREIDGGSDAGSDCRVSGTPGLCVHIDDCAGVSTPGFCPGPADIQCCTPSAGGTCDPSEMPSPNDGIVEAPGDSGCPDGMVNAGAFCIDRYEAFLVIADDTGPIGSWSPFHNPRGTRVRAMSAAGAIPQGYIDQVSASAACLEAEKRLCTETEWLRACRGPSGSTYPYGDTRITEVCNETRDGGHPAIERFGSDDPWVWSSLGDACINQLPDSVMPAGAHEGCVSADGAFDMMGNLHEWVADPMGTFLGGFYYDTYRNGEGCSYRTGAHDVSHWDYSTGFRCCANVR
jgi:sulfatase modifying factor 1